MDYSYPNTFYSNSLCHDHTATESLKCALSKHWGSFLIMSIKQLRLEVVYLIQAIIGLR